MNRERVMVTALVNGLMPLLPHPEARSYLFVKRVACGCEFARGTGEGRLAHAGNKCPQCGDRTVPVSLPWPDTFAASNPTIGLPVKRSLFLPAKAPLAKFERALGNAVQDLPRPPEPPAKASRDMISRVAWLERQMQYVQDTHTAILGGAEERLKQQDATIKALEHKIAGMADLLDGVLTENKLRLPPPFDPD